MKHDKFTVTSRVRLLSRVFALFLIAMLLVSFRATTLPRFKPNLAPPTFSKAFSPTTIGPGSVSILTFTMTNSDPATPVSDMAFTDNLPAGMTLATPAGAKSDCDGILSAPDGGTAITLSGGRLGTSSTCTISVSVTSSTVGALNNVSGDLTSSAGNSGTASATLTVASDRPGFSKSFAPAVIPPGGTSTLTFLIDNSANGGNESNISFSDKLPPNMIIATPANASTTCPDPPFPFQPATLTADAGTDTISFSRGVLSGLATCTISVDVTTTVAGPFVNISGDLSSSAGPSGKTTASLNVAFDYLIKSFSNDPAPPGGTVTLQYTVTNFDRGNDATNIAFTDDLNAALAGLSAIDLPKNDICGAGSQLSGTTTMSLTGGNLLAEASCTFSVTLQVPAGATPGVYPSTSAALTANIGGVPTTKNTATDQLAVKTIPRLTKNFTDDPVISSGMVTLEFTVENTSQTSAATAIAFIDNLSAMGSGITPTGLPLNNVCGAGSFLTQFLDGDTLFLALSGGNLAAGGSCTFSLTLQVGSDVESGNYLNTTGGVSANVGGEILSGFPASDTLVVVSPPNLSKVFLNAPVLSRGTVDLEFTLTNNPNAPADATNITFTDDLSATVSGLAAVGLPQSDVCGTGSQLSGTTNLSFSGGTLAAGATCAFSVTLQMPNTEITPGKYTNQTSNITATVAGLTPIGNAATADLEVGGLALRKSFLNNPVLPGDTLTLEFTVGNSSTVSSVTNISFSDNLKTTLSGLTVTGLPKSDICGSGSNLTAINPTFFSLTGGNLAAGESCTFTVTLQVPAGAAEGSYSNTTSNLTASVGSTPVVISPATDTLAVVTEVLLLSKRFDKDLAFAGDTVNLVFSMTNTFPSATATSLTFADDLNAALTGLAAIGLPINDVCGAGSQFSGTTSLTLTGGTLAAGATCVFTVTLQLPNPASPGEFTNTTGQATATMNSATVNSATATDKMQVLDPLSSGQIIFDKVTMPIGDPTSFNFTLDGGPATFNRVAFSLSDTATPKVVVVDAGSGYNASEVVPTGWRQSSATCSDGSTVNNIIVSGGEVITCTFNNFVAHDAYLPLVFRNAAFLPDLIIDSFVVSSNQVTVTVKNNGVTSINDAFWVQIAINPATPPTAVNQRWDTLGNSQGGAAQGALWGVVGPVYRWPLALRLP